MRKKAVLIGKGYWGSILQNYIYKDYQLIAIFGKDYRENDLIRHLKRIFHFAKLHQNVIAMSLQKSPLHLHYQYLNHSYPSLNTLSISFLQTIFIPFRVLYDMPQIFLPQIGGIYNPFTPRSHNMGHSMKMKVLQKYQGCII